MSSYGRNSQLFYLMCNNKCVNDVQSATKVHISYHFLCFWTDFKCHKLKDAKCLSLFDEACLWGHYDSSAELFELSVDAAPHSSVASPICQEGQIERSFTIFAFSSWFFPDFSWFFPTFGNFFAVRGGTLPPVAFQIWELGVSPAFATAIPTAAISVSAGGRYRTMRPPSRGGGHSTFSLG